MKKKFYSGKMYFKGLIKIQEERTMRLTPPKKLVFIITLILFIVGLVAHFVNIPFATAYQYWILVVAYVLLAAGVALKGF